MDRKGLTRRQTLGLAGSAGAALALAGAGKLITGRGDSAADLAEAARTSLRLTPEQTEGPFYVDLGKIRKNIVDGSGGVRMTLLLRVLNPSTCKPIEDAAVDIWHCNAGGEYSAEASEGTAGEDFLRGIQLTDRDGYAEFKTVYPGYYEGRATHIHLKVHVGGRRSGRDFSGGRVAHTGQLFFPESLSDRVYARSSYSAETAARVSNGSDGIYTGQGGARSKLKFRGSVGSGLTGAIVLGVR